MQDSIRLAPAFEPFVVLHLHAFYYSIWIKESSHASVSQARELLYQILPRNAREGFNLRGRYPGPGEKRTMKGNAFL